MQKQQKHQPASAPVFTIITQFTKPKDPLLAPFCFTSYLSGQVDEQNKDRYVHPDSEAMSSGHVSLVLQPGINPEQVCTVNQLADKSHRSPCQDVTACPAPKTDWSGRLCQCANQLKWQRSRRVKWKAVCANSATSCPPRLPLSAPTLREPAVFSITLSVCVSLSPIHTQINPSELLYPSHTLAHTHSWRCINSSPALSLSSFLTHTFMHTLSFSIVFFCSVCIFTVKNAGSSGCQLN